MIKLRNWFYILAKRAPHLLTLLLDSIIPAADELSQLVSTLFIGFPSLNSVLFNIREHLVYGQIGINHPINIKFEHTCTW
jgi:hypothetical protein